MVHGCFACVKALSVKELALQPLGSWPNSNWWGRRGILADVAEAVDPITLLTLVSTAEALISAGITDPYEFYQRTTPNSFMTTTDQVSIRTDGIKAAFLKSFDIGQTGAESLLIHPNYKEKTFGDVLSAKSDVKAVPS
ncbi:unnamed protein product [Aphanomyces euteiches]